MSRRIGVLLKEISENLPMSTLSRYYGAMADTPETKPAAPDDITEKALREALARADIPKIYANGFAVGMSNADVMIVFQRFGPNPVAVVNLSYTLAKTLAQRLGRAVQEFENKILQNILTTDRIDEAFKEASAAAKSKSDEVH